MENKWIHFLPCASCFVDAEIMWYRWRRDPSRHESFPEDLLSTRYWAKTFFWLWEWEENWEWAPLTHYQVVCMLQIQGPLWVAGLKDGVLHRCQAIDGEHRLPKRQQWEIINDEAYCKHPPTIEMIHKDCVGSDFTTILQTLKCSLVYQVNS